VVTVEVSGVTHRLYRLPGQYGSDEKIKAAGTLIYTDEGVVLKCDRPGCPMVWRRTVEEFDELVGNAALAGDRWVMLPY
jgi:hypothetical protein